MYNTPIRPDYGVEAELSTGVWTDITEDVVHERDIEVFWGWKDPTPTKRVADTGYLKFYLDNNTSNSAGLVGYYTPTHTNCRSGFAPGLNLRIWLDYNDYRLTKKFRIPSDGGIIVVPGVNDNKLVKVVAYDWMNEASEYELEEIEVEAYKRVDEALVTILGTMVLPSGNPIPWDYDFDEGVDELPTVFDRAKDGAKALTEIARLTLTDLGYYYVRATHSTDGSTTSGEKLIFENRYHRAETEVLSVQASTAWCDFLTDEDGNYLTTEDGDILVIDSAHEMSFDDEGHVSPNYGEQIWNLVQTGVYPRDVGEDDDTVLASMNEWVYLGPNETREGIRLSFRDPANLNKNVAGIELITEESGVDYIFNSSSDGTGTDLTSNLSISRDDSSTFATYDVENTSGTLSGFFYLQVRGRLLRSYDKVTTISKDATLMKNDGRKLLTLNMTYQNSIYVGRSFADYLLAQYKTGTAEAYSIGFNANMHEKYMLGLLVADIGTKVEVKESVTAVDAEMFIHGVYFSIKQHGIIDYRWYLGRELSGTDDWFNLDTDTMDGPDKLAP